MYTNISIDMHPHSHPRKVLMHAIASLRREGFESLARGLFEEALDVGAQTITERIEKFVRVNKNPREPLYHGHDETLGGNSGRGNWYPYSQCKLRSPRVLSDESIDTPILSDPYLLYCRADELVCRDIVTLDEVWTYKLDQDAVATPIICGMRVFIQLKSTIHVVDLQFGQMLSVIDFQGAELAGWPAINDSLLFVGTDRGELFALDKEFHKKVWQKNLEVGHGTCQPLVTANHGKLLLYSNGSSIEIVDSQNGKMLSCSDISATNTTYGANRNHVFIGDYTHVHAYTLPQLPGGQYKHLDDIEPSYTIKASDRVSLWATISDDFLALKTVDNHVILYVAETGELIWDHKLESSALPLGIVRDNLFFSDEDNFYFKRLGTNRPTFLFPHRIQNLQWGNFHVSEKYACVFNGNGDLVILS